MFPNLLTGRFGFHFPTDGQIYLFQSRGQVVPGGGGGGDGGRGHPHCGLCHFTVLHIDQLREHGPPPFDWRTLQASPLSGSHFWRGNNLEINIDISQSGPELPPSPRTASILAVRAAIPLTVSGAADPQTQSTAGQVEQHLASQGGGHPQLFHLVS